MSEWQTSDATNEHKFGDVRAIKQDDAFCVLDFSGSDLEQCFNAIATSTQYEHAGGLIFILKTPENDRVVASLKKRESISTVEQEDHEKVVVIRKY